MSFIPHTSDIKRLFELAIAAGNLPVIKYLENHPSNYKVISSDLFVLAATSRCEKTFEYIEAKTINPAAMVTDTIFLRIVIGDNNFIIKKILNYHVHDHAIIDRAITTAVTHKKIKAAIYLLQFAEENSIDLPNIYNIFHEAIPSHSPELIKKILRFLPEFPTLNPSILVQDYDNCVIRYDAMMEVLDFMIGRGMRFLCGYGYVLVDILLRICEEGKIDEINHTIDTYKYMGIPDDSFIKHVCVGLPYLISTKKSLHLNVLLNFLESLDEIDLSELKIFFDIRMLMARQVIVPIAFALSELPIPIIIEIVDQYSDAIKVLSYHLKWNIIFAIKHPFTLPCLRLQ